MKRARPPTDCTTPLCTPECYWDSLLVDDVRTLILTEYLDVSSGWLFGCTSTQNLAYVQARVPDSVSISYGRGKSKKVAPLSILAFVYHGHTALIALATPHRPLHHCVYQFPIVAQLPYGLVDIGDIHVVLRLAKHGHAECFDKTLAIYRNNIGVRLAEQLIDMAIRGDNIANLKLLIARCKIDMRYGDKLLALAMSSTNCVMYAHEIGLQSWYTCGALMPLRTHDMALFRFCVDHGYPIDLINLKQLVRSGLAQHIEYALAKGAAWGPSDLVEIFDAPGTIKDIQLAREFACPWPDTFLYTTLESHAIDVFSYALDNGCPVPPSADEQRAIVSWLVEARLMPLACRFIDVINRPPWTQEYVREYINERQADIDMLASHLRKWQ